MRFEGEEDGEVIDGEVIGRSEPLRQVAPPGNGPTYVPFNPDAYAQADASGFDVTELVGAGVGLAMDPKARALALIVKIPVFAYVAFSARMPLLVRLAAAGLGAAEVLEALQRRQEIESFVPPELR